MPSQRFQLGCGPDFHDLGDRFASFAFSAFCAPRQYNPFEIPFAR
jgi:hypothetical protein